MNRNTPLKSVSPKMRRIPIVVREKSTGYDRLLVQTGSKHKIEELLSYFLDKCPDTIEVLLKVDTGEYTDEGDTIWDHFFGRVLKTSLSAYIKEYQSTVYHDGQTQFLIKNPENQEYVCLDDHGLLYFYLDDFTALMKLLSDFTQDGNADRIIFSKSHWHYRPGGAEDALKNLIDHLGLSND